MPLPRALGRFNRRVTNRLLGPLLLRLPGFATLVHVGRRTGRTHRTPVLVFRRGRTAIVALTYGPEADWVRDVLAAGGCRIERGASCVGASDPRLRHDPARSLVPPPVRLALVILGAADFLELRLRGRCIPIDA